MIEKPASFLGNALSEFLSARSGFAGEQKKDFARMIVKLVQAMQEGHICIEVDVDQQKILENCRLVSDNGMLPVVLKDSRLYLARYYLYEKKLAETFRTLSDVMYRVSNIEQLLQRCFPISEDEKDWQRDAAHLALKRGLCIISGGPGTGKTTTIVKIVGLLLTCYGPGLRVALAAPTGKAAMRMRESVVSQVSQLSLNDEVKAAIPNEVRTIHRLLGGNRYSSRFKHNSDNPMLWDVVVVDEASMVDLAMMSKLSQSLKKGARLILIGDKDQLASVESGAVLSDCIQVLKDNVVELQKSYRFESSISTLAKMVNLGESAKALELLDNDSSIDVTMANQAWDYEAGEKYCKFMDCAAAVQKVSDLPDLFSQFNKFRILCAIRYGSKGVTGVNGRIEKILAAKGFRCRSEQWYTGRPVIVSKNDYSLGLFNGDIGICLPDFGDGTATIWFEQADGSFRSYSPARMTSCETVWAMTVHKSQGSEFDEVMVILPEKDNTVLCRELIYTAVTRAKRKVSIFAERKLFTTAVERKLCRLSGLAKQIEKVALCRSENELIVGQDV